MVIRRLIPLLVALALAPSCSDVDGVEFPRATLGTFPTSSPTTTTVPTDTSTPSTTAPIGTTSSLPGGTTTTWIPDPSDPRALGIGDPYFPDVGNPGYDVEHYTIDITIDTEAGSIAAATTVIDAVAATDLRSINLDFEGLEVLAVSVDGTTATWVEAGPDLVVIPSAPVPAGEGFSIEVTYFGTPVPEEIESIGLTSGWIAGGPELYVMAEPVAGHTWFPSNDHPSDKATFTFSVTVPEGLTAVSPGELVDTSVAAGTATYVWEMRFPMTTYLATVVVGRFERRERVGPGGIILRDYLPADLAANPPSDLDRTAEMLPVFEEWFGAYPFDRYGHVLVTGFPGALENQTIAVMGRGATDDVVVAHELAHQWFGDDVAPADWAQVWLNEGFATFGEFLWLEHSRGESVMLGYAGGLHRSLGATSTVITDPGIEDLFGSAVYWRGGLTLLALRYEVGDDVMKDILRTYAARFGGGSATTGDFIAVAESVTGRDLGSFFQAWLFEPAVPPLPGP